MQSSNFLKVFFFTVRKRNKMLHGNIKNEGVENAASDSMGGKHESGKPGTNLQEWKTREQFTIIHQKHVPYESLT